jgi:integrase
MALLKKDIDSIPASGKRKGPNGTVPYKLADGAGLYLYVTQTALLWRWDYRLNRPGQPDHRKWKTASFGEYSAAKVGVGDLAKADFGAARQRHLAARDLVAAGGDPAGEAKEAKQAAKATVHATRQASRKLTAELVYAKPPEDDGTSPVIFAPGTVGFAADAYDATLKKKADLGKRSEKTRARDLRNKRYIQNSFGSVGMMDARVTHLTNLLDVFEGADKFATRQRLQSTALNIMGYAEARGWLGDKTNPFLGIRFGNAYTPPANEERPAIVEAEAFGKLLRDLATYDGRQGNLIGKALDLLNLTFVRPGNIVNAEWSEFDLDDEMLWTIPFKKLKQRTFREGVKELKGKPHFVPLSRQAVALLRALKRQTGNSSFVFPVHNNQSGHITAEGLESAVNLLGYKDVHCPHGFRSSASTLLNAERITVEGNELERFAERVIEFQLEHVKKDVAAIYNRNQRLPERIKLMQFWADKCDAMREGKKEQAAKFKIVA